MTAKETQNVLKVYNKFLSLETEEWGSVDEYLEMLDYLEDKQLYKEARAMHMSQEKKSMGCTIKHKNTDCFVPHILSAVDSILNNYKSRKIVSKKGKYILQYYLALVQDGQIRELVEP